MFLLINVRSLLQNATAFTGIGLGMLGSEAKAQEPFITDSYRGSQHSTYVYAGGRMYGGYGGGNVAIITNNTLVNNGVYVGGNNNAPIYHNSPQTNTVNSPGTSVNNSFRNSNQTTVVPPTYRVRQYIGPPRPIHGHPPIHLSPIENPGLGRYHTTQQPVYEQPQSRTTFPGEIVSQPTQSNSGVVISRRDLTPGELAQFRQYGTVIKFEK